MAGFKFNQEVRHERMRYYPGVVFGFEDPDAAPYFKACQWGDYTDEPIAVNGVTRRLLRRSGDGFRILEFR